MEKAIYKTLIYSDMFDYPLTGSQIFQTLPVKISRKKLLLNLKKIPHKIYKNTIYYFLFRRENIIALREQREKLSIKKMQKAQRVALILSHIPTITFIGISGSLAIKNADKKSDIDLFFITKPHTVWLTRFLVYAMLHILKVRRKKGKFTSDTICANMFVDERYQRFTVKKRNLYVAHEIIQLFPLINRNYSFEKFLLSNKWIQNHFPNIFLKKVKTKKAIPFSLLLYPVEYIFRIVQLWYMQKGKTRETTTQFIIAFHPYDYEGEILNTYQKRLKKHGI